MSGAPRAVRALRGARSRAASGRTFGALVDAALGAALAQPWCDVVLSGAVTVAQLRSNAAALDLAATVDPERLVAPEEPQRYWAARGRRSWS